MPLSRRARGRLVRREARRRVTVPGPQAPALGQWSEHPVPPEPAAPPVGPPWDRGGAVDRLVAARRRPKSASISDVICTASHSLPSDGSACAAAVGADARSRRIPVARRVARRARRMGGTGMAAIRRHVDSPPGTLFTRMLPAPLTPSSALYAVLTGAVHSPPRTARSTAPSRPRSSTRGCCRGRQAASALSFSSPAWRRRVRSTGRPRSPSSSP